MDDIRLKTAPFISIHAPHEGERRCWPTGGLRAQAGFQSTLPTRGSDGHIYRHAITAGISIHAPHEGERRCMVSVIWYHISNFNPRSPRGGATIIGKIRPKIICISIHAPHEGERRPNPPPIQGGREFQSTLPTRGSDPLGFAPCMRSAYFNPRSPRGGATL